MTNEQRQELKQRRADAIARCANIISTYFEVDYEKVMSSIAYRDPRVKWSRFALFYHLHRCGMSYARIGKIWDRKESAIYQGVRVEYSRLDKADREMVDGLPMIPNSLEIHHADSNKIASTSQNACLLVAI